MMMPGMTRYASTPALPTYAQPYMDIQTRQNAIIDQRSYTTGIEDIRTVSSKGVTDTYVPVTIQQDTYTPGQIVTDNYVPVGAPTPVAPPPVLSGYASPMFSAGPVAGYASPMPPATPMMIPRIPSVQAAPMMQASPMMGARSVSYTGLPGVGQPYMDIQTRQNAVIDQRSYTTGIEDIRTVSSKGVTDTYVPVTIQQDTYTPAQIVTDNYVPLGATAPAVSYASAPMMSYAPTMSYAAPAAVAPPMSYSTAPQMSYSMAPPMSYSVAPPVSYSAPMATYAAPTTMMAAPAAVAPTISYAAPMATYSPYSAPIMRQPVGAMFTETQQPVMIDQRSYTTGIEDIRTVSSKGVTDTYVPVTIQQDTYTPGTLVTDTVQPVYA